LQTIDQLAEYSRSTVQVKDIHDTYLDTRRRQILAAGYSCRRREMRDGIVMTLKSLDSAEGAVHRGGEWEVTLAFEGLLVNHDDREKGVNLLNQTRLFTLLI
jgi:inorganic triphosphatase YgiF